MEAIFHVLERQGAMEAMFYVARSGSVISPDGRVFDSWDWRWKAPEETPEEGLRPVDALEALRAIGQDGRAARCRSPSSGRGKPATPRPAWRSIWGAPWRSWA